MNQYDSTDDDYTPQYLVKPPPIPKTSRPEPKKIDNLIDYEHELFQLTLANFAPQEPANDLKHKPVRKIRMFENHDKSHNGNIENVSTVVTKLKSCDKIRVDHIKMNDPVHAELRASEHRLQLVRRGVPLNKVLYNENHQEYQVIEPPKRFKNIQNAVRKVPPKYSGIPQSRKIQFLYPTKPTPPDHVDLISKINMVDARRNKLKQLKQQSNEIQLRYYNEMLEYLNHCNERRIRASRQFFDDMADYGLERAEINSKRNAQRSRLRVMCKAEWWDDFMNEAVGDNITTRITPSEQSFLERLSRKPSFTISEFIDLVIEMEKREKRMKKKDRCREWLDWINERCQIIDKATLHHILEEKTGLRFTV